MNGAEGNRAEEAAAPRQNLVFTVLDLLGLEDLDGEVYRQAYAKLVDLGVDPEAVWRAIKAGELRSWHGELEPLLMGEEPLWVDAEVFRSEPEVLTVSVGHRLAEGEPPLAAVWLKVYPGRGTAVGYQLETNPVNILEYPVPLEPEELTLYVLEWFAGGWRSG